MKKLIKSALFLGAGGVSMSRLAKAYMNMGVQVFAYDKTDSATLKQLKELGATTSTRFNKDFLSVDICISSPAISKTNKYIIKLKERTIPIIDRAEALNDLFKNFKTVIAVAGTHGKSTTSALIYHILNESGEKVSCHIGANVANERFCFGDDYLVVEACEFNRSFLYLSPDIAVVTNVEPDHMDTYKNLFDLRSSFTKFVRKAKSRFVFSSKSTAFLKRIKNIQFVNPTEKLETKLVGEYNQHNIALAKAVCLSLNIDSKKIDEAIKTFDGLDNRNEFIGKYQDADIIIDYAHHPTEIECFCSAFLDSDSQIVFQPHTYSRTKYLFKEFVRVLSDIPDLIIYKEYPARETSDRGLSAYDLYKEVKRKNPFVRYAKNPSQLKNQLKNTGKIAFVGAGDICKLAKNIASKLKKSVDKR